LFTLDDVGIDAMIREAKRSRKARLELSQDLLVEMRPEFAAALQNCQSFSSKFCLPLIIL